LKLAWKAGRQIAPGAARSKAIAVTGALARAIEKEIALLFRPSRALIPHFSNLRAAPGAVYPTAFQAGIVRASARTPNIFKP